MPLSLVSWQQTISGFVYSSSAWKFALFPNVPCRFIDSTLRLCLFLELAFLCSVEPGGGLGEPMFLVSFCLSCHTGRSHSPHGKVSAAVVVGPGLSSTSPAVAKRRKKRRRYLGGVFRSVVVNSRLRKRGLTVFTVLLRMVKRGMFSVGLEGDRAFSVDVVTPNKERG